METNTELVNYLDQELEPLLERIKDFQDRESTQFAHNIRQTIIHSIGTAMSTVSMGHFFLKEAPEFLSEEVLVVVNQSREIMQATVKILDYLEQKQQNNFEGFPKFFEAARKFLTALDIFTIADSIQEQVNPFLFPPQKQAAVIPLLKQG